MIRNVLILAAGAVWSAGLSGQTSATASSFQYAAWGAAHGGPIEGRQYGPVTGRPFSATEVRRSVQTLNDGTEVEHSDTSRFYRDVEGRMRAESPTRAEIFDWILHVRYDVDLKNKTYSTLPIPERTKSMSVAVVGGHSSTTESTDSLPEAARRSPGPGKVEELGTQLINGMTVRGTRVTMTIPVNAIGNNREIKVVNERWYSDELQALVKSSNNDPRFGVNTYELIHIEQGDPDPLLFQPPAGYTLVPERR